MEKLYTKHPFGVNYFIQLDRFELIYKKLLKAAIYRSRLSILSIQMIVCIKLSIRATESGHKLYQVHSYAQII